MVGVFILGGLYSSANRESVNGARLTEIRYQHGQHTGLLKSVSITNLTLSPRQIYFFPTDRCTQTGVSAPDYVLPPLSSETFSPSWEAFDTMTGTTTPEFEIEIRDEKEKASMVFQRIAPSDGK